MMVPRPDLLDERSPSGIEIFQLTDDGVPSSHIYTEAQVFTPDSKRLIIHRSATAHRGDTSDPEHQYLLCDLDNHGALAPLTDELGATGPAISPDGSWMYYFVNALHLDRRLLELRRVGIGGGERSTVAVVEDRLPNCHLPLQTVYPLSTIRSDGAKIATCGFMGDMETPNSPFGLWVFDIADGTGACILAGSEWCNIHPQYCRSRQENEICDVLIQHNHGCSTDERGRRVSVVGELGADIHVIRDSGTGFRDLPWGRDGTEACQGHQCWRGRSQWAIAGTSIKVPGSRSQQRLIEARPVPAQGDLGRRSAGAQRNDLSRDFDGPRFCHFATDIAGDRLITDFRGSDGQWHCYLGRLGQPGVDGLQDMTYLLNTRTPINDSSLHTHPFLSPDGSSGFFNSAATGRVEAYMIRGW